MRKIPRQARSRQTVEAIVEAAARILAAYGWAGFNTNRIAEAAGVSIGSLYQYFPDKQSLVDAIREQHLGHSLEAVRGSLDSAGSARDFVRLLVDAVIAAHSIHPRLHRVLLDEAPNADGFRDPDSAFERVYLGCFTEAVTRYATRGSARRDEVAGKTMSDALDGIIHNAARRDKLGDAMMNAELLGLMDGMLTSAAGRP